MSEVLCTKVEIQQIKTTKKPSQHVRHCTIEKLRIQPIEIPKHFIAPKNSYEYLDRKFTNLDLDVI